MVNELARAPVANNLDVFFAHVMTNPGAGNLDDALIADTNDAPVAAKKGLIFGACILAVCVGTAAYIQYTAPNLVIFLT
tara:strand:- start:358 stop:594 length:237 start_codon:yes stop_codon:yes gene_type:complete